MQQVEDQISVYHHILNNVATNNVADFVGGFISGYNKHIDILDSYIAAGLNEEQALANEIVAYNLSEHKNAEILFCAFHIVHKIVHKKYLNARRVNPEDTQAYTG